MSTPAPAAPPPAAGAPPAPAAGAGPVPLTPTVGPAENRRRLHSAILFGLVALLGVVVVLYAWRLPPFSTPVQSTENAMVRGQPSARAATLPASLPPNIVTIAGTSAPAGNCGPTPKCPASG